MVEEVWGGAKKDGGRQAGARRQGSFYQDLWGRASILRRSILLTGVPREF